MVEFGRVKKVGKINFESRKIDFSSKFDAVSPPSIFIGSKLKYPNVNVGILSPMGEFDNAEIFDDYKFWAKNNFSINNVLRLRSNLLNSRFKSKVTDSRISSKFVDIVRDISISSNPVDLELELKKKIHARSNADKVLAPHGFAGELKKAEITSDFKVKPIVDKVMNDEVRAGKGMEILYKKGIDEYSISKIFSVGALGLDKDKKLVPTRWSITATDDIISKEILKEVKKKPEINDYELLFGEFLGNQYLILLFPDVFNFELFEFYYPGSSWNSGVDFKASHDYENFYGRTEYALNCAGGYYATRLPIVQYLKLIGRQAGVVAIRLETPSYWASLGVWVVRESVKKAIEKGPIKFSSKEEFLDAVKQIGKIKYDFDVDIIYEKSWYLNNLEKQYRLNKWF